MIFTRQSLPFVVFLKRFILRFIHLLQLFFFFPTDTVITLLPAKRKQQTLLLLKLEGIGDYMLFRNFIEHIKKHSHFSGYAITLCGNCAFKHFAETFDSTSVQNFIWLESKKFERHPLYRWKMLAAIRKKGFEVVVYPTHSRDSLLGDSIVRCSGAQEKIGCYGDDVHSKNWERKIFNKYYTMLVDIPNEVDNEFLRNKKFFEQLLNKPIAPNKPFIEIQVETNHFPEPYAVLCPDAGLLKKRWRFQRFVDVAEYLYQNYGLKSVFVGGQTANSLHHHSLIKTLPFVIWKVGQTSLVETTQLISNASLVVSNDTAVSHIAVALNKPVVVISNGEHYGRFTYPTEVYNKIFYAFPPELTSSPLTYEERVKKFKYGSFLDINTIHPEDVFPLLDKALQK